MVHEISRTAHSMPEVATIFIEGSNIEGGLSVSGDVYLASGMDKDVANRVSTALVDAAREKDHFVDAHVKLIVHCDNGTTVVYDKDSGQG